MQIASRIIPKGEVIFREGATSQYAYYVKSGKVEIYTERDGHRIVLDRVGPGRCFGEMGAILQDKRSGTAVAREYSEVYTVDKKTLIELVKKSNPLIKTIIVAIFERLKKVNEGLSGYVPNANAILSFAKILELYGAGGSRNPSRAERERWISLPYREALDLLEVTSGRPRYQAKTILDKMAALNLVEVGGYQENKSLSYRPLALFGAAESVCMEMNTMITGSLFTDVELIELEQLAELVGVEPARIAAKLGRNEIPWDAVLFRKSRLLTLFYDQGREFFEKVKLKPVEELESASDIQFVDLDTLGRVLSGLPPYDLAQLLKAQEAAVVERALDALSPRVREAVRSTMEEIERVDEIKVLRVEERLIAEIKRQLSGE